MINFTRAGALILLAVAGTAALIALTFRVSFPTDPLGPRVFPFVAAALLAAGAPELLKAQSRNLSASGYGRIGGAVAAFLAYAVLLAPLGFVLATAAMFTALGLLFGGSLAKSCLAGVCSSLILYALFVYGLGLPLPLGFAVSRLMT